MDSGHLSLVRAWRRTRLRVEGAVRSNSELHLSTALHHHQLCLRLAILFSTLFKAVVIVSDSHCQRARGIGAFRRPLLSARAARE